jgi:hypothetical protein
MEEVKMFMFARWIATCYADTKIDNNNKGSHEEGFDSTTALSVLNKKDGHWYKKQIEHFNSVVYPNYVKNGSVRDTKEFFEVS